MLGTLSPEQKEDLNAFASDVVHAYNCTKNSATRYSPYYLIYGKEPRLPIDIEYGLQKDD